MGRVLAYGYIGIVAVAVASAVAMLAASCASPTSTTPALPELTNQRFMNLGGYQIVFGCDGTTGLYREQNVSWSIAVVPNDPHCR